MNSKLLLVLLFAAIVGTTWALVKLVQLPPPEARGAYVQDTAAVADRKAVVNPFAPRPTSEAQAVADSARDDRDSARGDTDSGSEEAVGLGPDSSDTTGQPGDTTAAASGGARP